MSYTDALMAIQNTPTELILDVLSAYYSKHYLTLVEERVGNMAGKYVNPKVSYRNLEEYQLAAYPQEKQDFTTNFDIYDNLDENKQWKIIVFYPDVLLQSSKEIRTVYINYELAQLISKNLKTVVLLYENIDVVDSYQIRKYVNGNLIDKLSASEGEIFEKVGYFEEAVESLKSDIYETVEQYLEMNEFFPEGDDIENLNNEKQRHPLYLKGHPDDIIKFFEYQSKFGQSF
jgi:hypothetical protein